MDMRFALKHWILTLIAGAFITVITMPIVNNHRLPDSGSIGFGFLILAVSVLFSLPAAILYCIAAYALNLAPVNHTVKKTLLILFSAVTIFLTFKAIGGTLEKEFAIFYIAATILTGIFLK